MNKVFLILRKVLLYIVGFIIVFPIAYGLIISITSVTSLGGGEFILMKPLFKNYTDLLLKGTFFLYIRNTIFISSVVTALSLLISLLAAYPLSRWHFKGDKLIFTLILSSLMIPSHITLIPNYLTMAKLKLLDTYSAMVLPFLGNAFTLFFFRQQMKRLPSSLDEAATIDGASSLRILFQIFLPLMQATIISMMIFTFLGQWNSYIWPLIVTNSDRIRTIQIGLSQLYKQEAEESITNWPLVMAGCFIVSLPIIVIFLLSQKYFIKGITEGSVKT